MSTFSGRSFKESHTHTRHTHIQVKNTYLVTDCITRRHKSTPPGDTIFVEQSQSHEESRKKGKRETFCLHSHRHNRLKYVEYRQQSPRCTVPLSHRVTACRHDAHSRPHMKGPTLSKSFRVMNHVGNANVHSLYCCNTSCFGSIMLCQSVYLHHPETISASSEPLWFLKCTCQSVYLHDP